MSEPTIDDLLDALNDDLKAEWGAIQRYTYQSAKAFGTKGNMVRDIIEGEIQDELQHAQYLSEVIADYGGEPTTEAMSFDKPEGIREMLELNVEMEQQDVQNYKEHSELAEQLGEIELQVRLEEIAADESGHVREFKRLLQDL